MPSITLLNFQSWPAEIQKLIANSEEIKETQEILNFGANIRLCFISELMTTDALHKIMQAIESAGISLHCYFSPSSKREHMFISIDYI